jgi:hypothetical protein
MPQISDVNKILKSLIKKCSAKAIDKFLKLISFMVCIYQIILLTRDYCKFQTVLDFKLIDSRDYLPAISICVDHWNKESRFDTRISGTLTIDETFGPMDCVLFFPTTSSGFRKKCNRFSDIESFTNSGKKCSTFFSRLDGSNRSLEIDLIFTIILYKPIDLFLLIHQNITTPHLSRNVMRIDKNKWTVVGYTSITEELLPYPYETNCFDYRNSLEEGNTYRSKEDCIVNYLRRKEYEKCGCNRNWIYYNKKNLTGLKICSKTNKCNFEYKFDESLMFICRKNCFNKYYDSHEDGKIESKNGYQHIILLKRRSQEISLTHSAKMNLNDYLSSNGGLLSMWFGLNVYDTFSHVLKILLNLIVNYFILLLNL